MVSVSDLRLKRSRFVRIWPLLLRAAALGRLCTHTCPVRLDALTG